VEQTLSILKPDAVDNKNIGAIIDRFEKAGLRPIAMKMVQLTVEQAKAFYAIHAERPFYMDLVNFVTEGPVVLMVLEGTNAVAENRTLMGATNPEQAAPGTIRKDFAKSIDRNAVHGSDSLENAKTEIAFFFSPKEIFSRAGRCNHCNCH
jgi:nucleoside-diphosphate kinase